MKKLAAPLCSLFCTAVFGQSQPADRTQSPAEDARWVTLIVKAHEGLTPLPLTLQYQSQKCKEERAFGVGGLSQSGTMQMRALNFEKPEWARATDSHDYKTRFAIDAGGPCQWKLQSLEFAFQYQSRNP